MEKYFVCEICKCETPIECEGSEPNTCADCMPPDIKFNALCERNGVKLKKLPREFVIPPKTAQNKPKITTEELSNVLQLRNIEDYKVIIWGKELCNGAEWKDFLDVVNELGKEKTCLEAKLEEQPKQIIEKIREKIVDYNIKYSSAVDVLNCLDLVLDNLLKENKNG